ncbi:hypothetical protein ACFY3N_01465 [Streptomyces sp. NPDC000348]|uniref:hypothetical protein n=1 Tax=Streptomyces sp. NPDC000348 TaxID=3364538 RepID=UPI00369796AD
MDRRLREQAKASPDFGRLYGHQPLLALYGSQAELTVSTHPNAAHVGIGQFGEVPAEEFVMRTGTRVEGTRRIDRLDALTRAGVLGGCGSTTSAPAGTSRSSSARSPAPTWTTSWRPAGRASPAPPASSRRARTGRSRSSATRT